MNNFHDLVVFEVSQRFCLTLKCSSLKLRALIFSFRIVQCFVHTLNKNVQFTLHNDSFQGG